MKTPRKLYAVVSKKAANRTLQENDLCVGRKVADRLANARNTGASQVHDDYGKPVRVTDWRVETFVKGD